MQIQPVLAWFGLALAPHSMQVLDPLIYIALALVQTQVVKSDEGLELLGHCLHIPCHLEYPARQTHPLLLQT